MTETLASGYSSESTPPGLSNEYQQDRVWVVFKNLCVRVLWMIVVSALEGLIFSVTRHQVVKVVRLDWNPSKVT